MANWKCAFDLNVAALWRCYWLQHAHQNFLWNKVVPPEKEGDLWAHIFSLSHFLIFLSLTQPPQPDYNFNLNFKWAKHCLFGIFFLCVCCFVCLTDCGLVRMLRLLSVACSALKWMPFFPSAFWSGDGCATATTMANIRRKKRKERHCHWSWISDFGCVRQLISALLCSLSLRLETAVIHFWSRS